MLIITTTKKMEEKKNYWIIKAIHDIRQSVETIVILRMIFIFKKKIVCWNEVKLLKKIFEQNKG